MNAIQKCTFLSTFGCGWGEVIKMDDDVVERVNDIWDSLELPDDKTPVWK